MHVNTTFFDRLYCKLALKVCISETFCAAVGPHRTALRDPTILTSHHINMKVTLGSLEIVSGVSRKLLCLP